MISSHTAENALSIFRTLLSWKQRNKQTNKYINTHIRTHTHTFNFHDKIKNNYSKITLTVLLNAVPVHTVRYIHITDKHTDVHYHNTGTVGMV